MTHATLVEMRHQTLHPDAPTLSDLVTKGHRLEIWCSGCGQFSYMAPADAVARLGAHTHFPTAARRLRCSRCGSRGRDGMVSCRASIGDIYDGLKAAGIGMP